MKIILSWTWQRNDSLVDHQHCLLQSLSFILLKMSTPYLCINFLYISYCINFIIISPNILIFMTNTQDIKMTSTAQRIKKVFFDNFINSSGLILWNSLKKNLKCSVSIKYFRKQYKHKLMLCPNMTNLFLSTVLSLVLPIHDLWLFFFSKLVI